MIAIKELLPQMLFGSADVGRAHFPPPRVPPWPKTYTGGLSAAFR